MQYIFVSLNSANIIEGLKTNISAFALEKEHHHGQTPSSHWLCLELSVKAFLMWNTRHIRATSFSRECGWSFSVKVSPWHSLQSSTVCLKDSTFPTISIHSGVEWIHHKSDCLHTAGKFGSLSWGSDSYLYLNICSEDYTAYLGVTHTSR